MTSPLFTITPPTTSAVPILLSIPHAGTEFPDEVASQFANHIVEHPEDTDWFVDKLYDFAANLGVTTIKANYSRYVIDLNRDPNNERLYQDDRHQTALVPSSTFSGKPLYEDGKPTIQEINTRLTQYYLPYHQALGAQLTALKQQFEHVLLFDAHSIKRFVATITDKKFPCLILGDNNETSAAQTLINQAFTSLQQDKHYQCSHNFPFRGGYITRHFADPKKGIHTLQLEMSQDIYMDEQTTHYNPTIAQPVKTILENTFVTLIKTLRSL